MTLAWCWSLSSSRISLSVVKGSVLWCVTLPWHWAAGSDLRSCNSPNGSGNLPWETKHSSRTYHDVENTQLLVHCPLVDHNDLWLRGDPHLHCFLQIVKSFAPCEKKKKKSHKEEIVYGLGMGVDKRENVCFQTRTWHHLSWSCLYWENGEILPCFISLIAQMLYSWRVKIRGSLPLC